MRVQSLHAPTAWKFTQAPFLLVQPEQITLLEHTRKLTCTRRDPTQTPANVEMDCHSALEKKKKECTRAEDNRRCNNTIKMASTAQSECH